MSEKMTISELNIKFTADTEELKAGLKGVTSQLDDLKKQAAAMTAAGTFKNMFVGVSAAYVGKQFASAGKSAVDMAMDVVESESLFETSMGKMASKARNWSEEISDALGLNAYSVRNNVGILYNMTTSMEIADSTAYDLSTTLTGLAYDMASFYNMDTDSAFYKIRAGITGETEPLKALGILVDENTVKQSAYKHGLATTGEELTKQQKVLGRYFAILDQTSNAQGDMARTLDSPANKMRRLKEEWNQAAIALGQSLLPVVQKAVPYVSALARITSEAISGLSGLTGTTLELSSASGSFDASNIKSSLFDISDEAKEAAESLKGATLGIDELNILSSSTDLSDMDLSGTYSYDLSTSGYNLLGDLTSQTDEAYEKVKDWLETIEPIAETVKNVLFAYGGYKVLTGIKNLGTTLKDLGGGFGSAKTGADKFTKVMTGAAGVAVATLTAYDVSKDLVRGTLDLGTAFETVVGVGGGIALAAAALGPYGALAAGFGSIAGYVTGAIQERDRLFEEFVLAEFFDGEGKSVDLFTEEIKKAWEEMDLFADKQDGYRTEITKTETEIKNTTTTVGDLIQKSQDSRNNIPECLTQVGDGFKTLKTTAQQNLTAKTDSICAMLDEVVKKADTDVKKAITGLKNEFWALQSLLGNELAAVESQANEILAKAISEGELTKSDSVKLQDLLDKMASYTGTGVSKNTTKMELAAEDVTKINFGENPDVAIKKMQDYLLAVADVESDINDSFATAKESITSLQSVIANNPELRKKALALNIPVDTMFKDSLNAAEDTRKAELAKLAKEKEGVYTQFMLSYEKQVSDLAKKYAEEETKRVYDSKNINPTTFSGGLYDRQDYYDAQYKKGEEKARETLSELYDMIQQASGYYGQNTTKTGGVPAWESSYDYKSNIDWTKPLKGYATGGMPRRAELFYAREDGMPELVGKIGSTTAVANNYQIEQGISDAVYKAMVSARGMGGGSEQPLIIQIVDDSGNLKAEQYISAAERKNLRDGRITIPLG